MSCQNILSPLSSCLVKEVPVTDVKSIPISDILHVKLRSSSSRRSTASNIALSTCTTRTHTVIVHYVTRTAKGHLRMATATLDGTQAECECLVAELDKKRAGQRNEEKKFLALINPVSGHGKSQRVFRSTVQPLLEKCDISCDVVVSSKYGELHHAAETRSLDGYSGVLIFGGDGSVNEVVSGLLKRAMKESEKNIDDFNCQLLPSTIPIGIFATGGGNWICDHIQGSMDVISTVINTIRGQTVWMSALTIHEPGQYRHMTLLVQHVGWLGDFIRKTELNRWMGPARYALLSHTSLIGRRLMSADLACTTTAPGFQSVRPPQQSRSTTSSYQSTPKQSSYATSSNQSTPQQSSYATSSNQSTPQQSSYTTSSNQSTPQQSSYAISSDQPAPTLQQERSQTSPNIQEQTTSCKPAAQKAFSPEREPEKGSVKPETSQKTTEEGKKDGSQLQQSIAESTVESIPGSRIAPTTVDSSHGSRIASTDVDHELSVGREGPSEQRQSHGTTGFLGETKAEYDGPTENTDHIRGEMYNICMTVTKHRTPDCRMETGLGWDTASLFAVKKCNLTGFVKHLVKLRDNHPGIDDFSFVESRDVVDVKLTFTSEETRKQKWYINSDGECVAIHSNVVYFRLHPRVFQAFCPTPEPASRSSL